MEIQNTKTRGTWSQDAWNCVTPQTESCVETRIFHCNEEFWILIGQKIVLLDRCVLNTVSTATLHSLGLFLTDDSLTIKEHNQ